MNNLEKLQEKITDLEQDFKELDELRQKESEKLQIIRSKLEFLKDLAWDRQSKKESSSMYKVLKEDKTHTMVKSEVGSIKVDKDFMEKEITKHLDNPNLRGMVTTKEMLSFPKVAKGVKAEFNPQYQGYTWKVKANDGNIIHYGEREYKINGKNTHRLLTTYSETEKGQRKIEKTGVGERGHSHRQINDPDFLRPANDIIAQKSSDKETRGYTWQVKANDGNILVYGSRKYQFNDEKIHRLATNHSKTERNERKAEEDRRGHPYHPIFNDLNFRKSADKEIIPQKTTKEVKTQFGQEQIKTMQEAVKKASQKLKENIKNKEIEL